MSMAVSAYARGAESELAIAMRPNGLRAVWLGNGPSGQNLSHGRPYSYA